MIKETDENRIGKKIFVFTSRKCTFHTSFSPYVFVITKKQNKKKTTTSSIIVFTRKPDVLKVRENRCA